MLQDHHAQQHPYAARWPPARAVGGGHLRFGLAKIDLTRDSFQHAIDAATLLQGRSKKVAWLSRGVCMRFRSLHQIHRSKTFAEISNAVVAACWSTRLCHNSVGVERSLG